MCHRVKFVVGYAVLVGAVCWFCAANGIAADEKKPAAILILTNDGQIPGELKSSAAKNVLRWHSPAFTKPFEFPLAAIKSVQYEMAGAAPAPVGEFCFELIDNDFVYADLMELTGDKVAVSSAKLGRILLARDHVRRIYRYKGADSVYLGPNGFLGWKERTQTRQWHDDGGQLESSQTGASIFADLGIPEKSRIEVEISWQRKPDFVLGLGVDEAETASMRGVHFEVWDQEMVVVAESARDADVASVQKIVPGPGRVRIQAYLDQTAGKLILLSPGGKPLATMNIRSKKAVVHTGIRLTNGRGDVRLESIRISRWNGQLPREANEEQTRIHRTDGTIAYGRVTAYDPKSKRFTLRDGETETLVPQDAVNDMFLQMPPPAAKAPPAEPAPAKPQEPEKQGNKPVQRPVKPPLKVTNELVDGYVVKDAEIRSLQKQIDRANTFLAKLRVIAAQPEQLNEYKEYVQLIAELKQKIARRTESVRPDIRKRLEAIAKEDPEAILEAEAKVNQVTPDIKTHKPAEPEGTVRLALRDGERLTGILANIGDADITLTCAGVKEPLRVPLAHLHSLIVPRSGAAPMQSAEGKAGRLEIAGLSLRGCLAPGSESPEASCIVWKPDLALSASPLALGTAGRILYREPPPTAENNRNQFGDEDGRVVRRMVRANGMVVQQVIVQGRVVQQIVPNNRGPQASLPGGDKPALHLRTGDTIPCEVTGIDDKGVTLKTPISDSNFIPNEKIKSVELTALSGSHSIDEPKRDRLLTLPRMQKDTPPTHLIYSKNGDFLRGRILSMNETELKVEVRLETRTIPRERVAQIVWFHQDELSDKPAPSATTKPSAKTRVQTIRPNGDRLTFVADKSGLEEISGRSDVLGACRVKLEDIDQLLFGSFIEQSAALLAYQKWKLHHAAEPRYVQADSGSGSQGGPSGVESPLVGQPASAIKLDMLAGGRFDLAEHRGRIVVLDFWATWCGPCMQSMPMIEEVAAAFADKQVDLIAVNLEEEPAKIQSVIERHKFKVAVALDRDGATSAKYGVTAIPQTVVIDREGKIVRLFVGGGKNTADALRKTLQELTEGKEASATPK